MDDAPPGKPPGQAHECPCGWELPDSVCAYPLALYPPTEEGRLTSAYVALICPQCGSGHSFFGMRRTDG